VSPFASRPSGLPVEGVCQAPGSVCEGSEGARECGTVLFGKRRGTVRQRCPEPCLVIRAAFWLRSTCLIVVRGCGRHLTSGDELFKRGAAYPDPALTHSHGSELAAVDHVADRLLVELQQRSDLMDGEILLIQLSQLYQTDSSSAIS
jgi:hypothetical protein